MVVYYSHVNAALLFQVQVQATYNGLLPILHESCQPVKPENQLLVLFLVEKCAVLMLTISSLVISTQLLNSLVNLITE